jgi:hypothetical protein
MDFYDLISLAQIKAIHAAIEPSLESIWRIRCREYSKAFHTPLHVVMSELDPMMVLQTLNEEKYHPSIVEQELEELLETLQKIKDPTYSKMDPQMLEDMVDAVLNKEIARLSKKKPPTPETIQTAIKTAEVKTPKSGGLDFSSLERMESEVESRKPGFES